MALALIYRVVIRAEPAVDVDAGLVLPRGAVTPDAFGLALELHEPLAKLLEVLPVELVERELLHGGRNPRSGLRAGRW